MHVNSGVRIGRQGCDSALDVSICASRQCGGSWGGGHTSADGLAKSAAGGASAGDAGKAGGVAAVVRGAADLASGAAGRRRGADATCWF